MKQFSICVLVLVMAIMLSMCHTHSISVEHGADEVLRQAVTTTTRKTTGTTTKTPTTTTTPTTSSPPPPTPPSPAILLQLLNQLQIQVQNVQQNIGQMATFQLNLGNDVNGLATSVLGFQSGLKDLQSQINTKKPVSGPMPTSCADYQTLGWTLGGFYMTKTNNQIQTKYCDFTQTSGSAGYETLIGYNDVKTSAGVYFSVKRKTTYIIKNTVLPYDDADVNVGGAMNIATGVFTAPTSGRYYFSFHGLNCDAKNVWVRLRLNGNGTSIAAAISKYDSLSTSTYLNLKIGDQVDTYLADGQICDATEFNQRYTVFSGMLLEQDLAL